MAMVGVASGSVQADSQPVSFGLSWGSAATWSHSILIILTGWTLKVACHDDSTINIIIFIITPPPVGEWGYCFRAISFFVYLFVSLFLCQQHYEKTAGPICMKFSGKVWSDHGTTWLNFGSIRAPQLVIIIITIIIIGLNSWKQLKRSRIYIQFNSSVAFAQSPWPSHTHPIGIHFPLALHRKYSSGHWAVTAVNIHTVNTNDSHAATVNAGASISS